ncbi:SigE family RNA polymerase sigma factor [Kribbella endophytica]
MTFDEWTDRGLPALLRFATVLCGSRHLAEDVVQDALLKAHRKWERVGQADSIDAYVRRMVVNEFLSWRRKWSRIIPRPEVRVDETAPDHAHQHADRDELIAQLAKLPARQRAVLVLRYYGGLSDHEIAETLGCSAGTVRGYASRALATLRVELTPTLTGAQHAN